MITCRHMLLHMKLKTLFLIQAEFALLNYQFLWSQGQSVQPKSARVSLVGFYGISTIIGYLMPNPLYTYILNIYKLVWFGFMAYQPL